MRYGLYVRKSTEEDERQAQSIEDQKTRCIELGFQKGIFDLEVFEEARSAKEEGRPQFNRMIAALDKGKLDGLIAWHPDRLSRNEMDAAAITKRLRKGILRDLLFVQYYFHNSPEGVMMLQMSLSQSQYFSSKLSGDVRRGMESKIRKGWSPHRAMPGYLNNKHMDKGEKTISPDPVRFPLIRKAFDYILSGGYTPIEVWRLLNTKWAYRTVKTRNGGDKPISRTAFYRLLTHVFYTGYFIQKGTVYPGKHTPMISLEEHQKMKRILGTEVKIQSTEHTFPYTGMIRCARCNYQITAQATTNRHGKEYHYYRCTQCQHQIVSETALQEQIECEIDLVAISVGQFTGWAHQTVERWHAENRTTDVVVYNQRRHSLEDVNRQLSNLLTVLTKGLITDEEYTERKDQLNQTRLDLKGEIDEAELRADRAREAVKNTIDFLTNAKAWIAFGDASTKRACMRAFQHSFLLDGKQIRLELHPLVKIVREEVKTLEARYLEIKPGESSDTATESQKKTLLASIGSTWSGIWYETTTLAYEENLWFPNIQSIISSKTR